MFISLRSSDPARHWPAAHTNQFHPNQHARRESRPRHPQGVPRHNTPTTNASASMEAGPLPPAAAAVPPKPQEDPAGMEAEAALLEAYAQLPAISKGWAFQGGDPYSARVMLQFSQRNLPANTQRKYVTQFPLSEALLEHGSEVDASLPTELRDVAVLAPSPSGCRTLIVRGGSNDTSAVLEVWDRSRLLKELHVPKVSSLHQDEQQPVGALTAAGGAALGRTQVPAAATSSL